MAGVPVYGVELSRLCESQSFLIPPFLTQLMKYIEEYGIDSEGIYRMSGPKRDNMKLKAAIEAGSGQEVELEGVNVHCATACLKWFFKEMPTSLIPYDMFHDFIQAAKNPSEERVEKLKGLVKQLPQPNYYILHQLVQHLTRIADHCKANQMPPKNIGIVFGFSLLRPEKLSSSLAGQFYWQALAIQTMVAQCDDIFPQHEPVFGCVLQELCERYSGVPPFLINFMNFIEKNGLESPELYKGSGISTKKDQLYMNMLKTKIEIGDHDLSNCNWATVPIVGGCIKEFFKELPEPLIPYDMHHSFIVAAKSLHTRRAGHLAILVKDLPEANFMTLLTLMKHLTKVCAMSDMNELTPANVGHIFGMVVMRPKEEMTLEVAMQNVRYQNRVVEVMMSSFETVFNIEPARKTQDGRKKKKQVERKDPAFGIDLTTKCENDEEKVPIFFMQSIEYLEEQALDIVGLYKVAANPAAVNLFRQLIETGEYFEFEKLNWIDVHVVANTLKQYLKELPESLIPSDLHDLFIEVAKNKHLPQKLKQYQSLLMELPDAHYRMLRYFLRHLKIIVLNKKANKSSATKMGILFGNIIMRSPNKKSTKKVLGLQNSVVEVLVRNYEEVFRRSFPVFGTDLAMLCKHERRLVPLFFIQIIDQLESRGLIEEVFVYRINGDQTVVQKIMEHIDEGEELDFDAPELLQGDILTGVVKNYLSQLPEPLIPPHITSELLTASTCKIESIRPEKFASILTNMPECNYCTLKFLLDHLMKVVAYGSRNKMAPSNLCIIFAPLLMRPHFIKPSHVNAVEILIDSWSIISDICYKYRYEPVFGGELSKVCTREDRMVPAFFEQFINYIEQTGLENKDIYKTLKNSSAISYINNLKERVDQGINLDQMEEWMTQQVVANCLKLYLLELPDPLIPYSLYDSFIAVIKLNQEHVERVEKLSFRVKELDFAHYHTLKFLMGHLNKIAEMSELNEMTPQVLGVIFGQIIIRPGPEKSPKLDLELVKAENTILRTMIKEYDSIFP